MLTTTVCAALSAAGLAVAFLTAYRRRFVAATRIAAFSLLPVGLAMSGLIGLLGKIVGAVGSWASGLVLKPTVWAGFAVLACAVVLYVISRAVKGGSPTRKERRAAARTEGGDAVSPGAGAPSLGAGAGQTASPARTAEEKQTSPKGSAPGGGEDFSDIEEILKKHGI